MSKEKFTPGPWAIEGEDDISEGLPCIDIMAGEYGPTYKQVCHVSSSLDADGDFALTDTDRANAALIAEAPNMLLAMQAAIVLCGSVAASKEAIISLLQPVVNRATEI